MTDRPEEGVLDPSLDAAKRRRQSDAARTASIGTRRLARFRHWFWGRRRPEPLPAVLGVLDPPPAEGGRRGICCSGGGIRSASFNLGALQALQERPHRTLQTSDHLAAVSGGAYIAAGFAWVAKVDGEDDSDPKLVDDDAPPFHPGSPEEQYLRNRSNYMAPGAMGKVRLVGRVVLGILLNLLFLGTLLFLVGWGIGELYGEWLFPPLKELGGEVSGRLAVQIAGGVLGASVLVGVLATAFRIDREAHSLFLYAWAGRLLVLAVFIAVMFAALPELLEWLREIDDKDTEAGQVKGSKTTAAALGGTSAAALLAGTLLQLRARMLDQRVLRTAIEAGEKTVRGFVTTRLLPRVRSALQLLLLAAVGPVLLGGILLGSVVLSLADDNELPLPILGGAFVVFAGLYLFGEVTSWSLHPFYRRRLCTAFALKRVAGEDGRPVAVERDHDRVVPLSKSGVEPVPDAEKPREWPQLLICAAANVSDPGATPPGRAVTSFTFSPTAIGGPLIGMVPTQRFEDELAHRERDFALPAAVAMSGAALSPSMGKMTHWPLRFLMTLANARLGVWVPNPRRMADDPARLVSKRTHWRPRAALLVNELLGRNSADGKFLYVTDGGHYENLGLVELLRRGCTEVLCFDASGGTDVQELGDAIALARTELQVEIDIKPETIAQVVPDPETGVAEQAVIEGDIYYPLGGPKGRLVYVRCVLTPGASHDIKAYHDRDPAFPHNSTGDQLYTDQRFEAYRKLGHQAGMQAVAVLRGR